MTNKTKDDNIIRLYGEICSFSGWQARNRKDNHALLIKHLQGILPDLIISDLNMPEMSGEEFLVYLKANDMFSHIPVLILSSVESSSNRIRLFEEGAEDFILKPFNPEELRVRVKRILR